jgi:hypothetical protein
LPGNEATIQTPKPGSTYITKPTYASKPTNGKEDSKWVYPLLGSLIGLCLVLLLGYYLWKKGYMMVPFLTKEVNGDQPSRDDFEE